MIARYIAAYSPLHHFLATRHSKSLSILSYDVWSCLSQFDIQRCQFLVMTFRVTIVFHNHSIQSHHILFSLAFRVVSLVWCLKPLFVFSSTFKTTSLVWHSESLFFLVQHSKPSCLSFVRCSKSHLQFGIQSQIYSLAFRVVYLVWHSEPWF